MTPDLASGPYLTLFPGLLLVAKATLILAIGLLAMRLTARARAASRHLVLAMTFASLLVLPLVTIATPPTVIPITTIDPAAPPAPRQATPAETDASSRAAVALAQPGASGWHWSEIAGLTWLAGAATGLVPLMVTIRRHRRLRRTGLPCPPVRDAVRRLAADAGLRRSIDLVLHEDVSSPLTFGLRQPVIVMPTDAREWRDADLRRALVHELEHIRRGDTAVHTAVRVVCAMWWFHPLAWAAKRRLALEAERSCDDAVVIKEENMEYAEQLVTLAQRLTATAQPTLGMANRSDLTQRVTALLDDTQRRGRAGAGTVVVTTILAAVLLIAIAPVRAVALVGPTPAVATAPERAEQNRRQRGLDRELYEAAEAGDLQGIGELLNAGASVNAAIDGDGSPLIAAARRGRIDAVRLLLDRGADPNMGVPGDGSPLIAAAAAGRLDMTILLLDRGAKVDLVVEGDENALIQASGAGHLPIVRLLVTRGADVNARVRIVNHRGEEEYRSPLRHARQRGHDAVVAYLVAAGARD